MFLIDSILLSPIKGIIWIGEKINGVIEKEASDEGLVKEKLMELQLRFELDEISEKEYDEKEKVILKQLDDIRKLKDGGV
ncbi:MAG: gas vesicle protein GvpG [bacterium]|nr:gas vesicle protein GvpG [bacterium]